MDEHSTILSEAREYVKEVADLLTPEGCEIFDSIKTDRPFTAVVLMPENISQKMEEFAKEISAIEPSLIISNKQTYHLTLNYIPGDRDVEKFKEIISEFFIANSLSFNLDTLFVSPRGIGVCAYPDSDSLIKLREILGKEFDFPFSLTGLTAISWVTLARYSAEPKQELIDFLKSKFNTKFGKLDVTEVAIFESNDKILEDAKKLFSIKAG